MIKKGALRKLLVFQDLPEEYLDKLTHFISERALNDGQEIFEEGSIGNALYIIGEGKVEIRKKINAKKKAFKTLALLEQGDYFGEMSLLDDKPRSASAYAQGKAVIYVLKRDDFTRLLQSSPRVAVDQLLGILKVMGDRLRQTTIELTTLYDIGRVISTLTHPVLICSYVISKLHAVLENTGTVDILLWNLFNEEYDIITEGVARSVMEGKNVALPSHPVVTYMKKNASGVLTSSIAHEKIFAACGEPLSGVEKFLGIPLTSPRGEELGLIIATRQSQENNFRNSDFILASAVSSITATALANASFVQEEMHRTRLEQGKSAW